MQFINFDKFFEGKRFCEQNNAADPIGANNAQVFFNDLTTILPTPGVAPLANQTVGLTGVNIMDLLQQASVFHPKGQLPYVGLVVEIIFRILLDAIEYVLPPSPLVLHIYILTRFLAATKKSSSAQQNGVTARRPKHTGAATTTCAIISHPTVRLSRPRLRRWVHQRCIVLMERVGVQIMLSGRLSMIGRLDCVDRFL